MTMPHTSHEPLSERARRLKRALGDSETGPLVVANEIRDLVQSWESYRAEAEGHDSSSWLIRTFGKGCNTGYWMRRARACDKLGAAKDEP